MAHDVSDAGLNPSYPVFLPAFQKVTIKNIMDRTKHRDFPGSNELNWYRPDNDHWKHLAGLYSLGHSKLEKDDTAEALLTTRDRERTILIADSGGYQIGKGTFSKYKNQINREFLRSDGYNQMLKEILEWMERYADYSMIVDFPAWAVGEEGFILPNVDECLAETKYNCEFFRDNYDRNSAVRFLTVIQGTYYGEALKWYETIKAVKDFPNRGWSFAGPVAGNPTITLKMILTMWRDGRLSERENWIHLLGKGSLKAMFVYSVLQQCINEYLFKGAVLSYDVSSPFLMTSYGQLYSHAVSNSNGMSFQDILMKPSDFTLNKTRHKEWCVWKSPFADDIDLNEFFNEEKKHDLDMRSYTIAAHHNVWVTKKAADMINFQASLPDAELYGLVPGKFINFRRDVRRIFENFSDRTNIGNLPISNDYAGLIE